MTSTPLMTPEEAAQRLAARGVRKLDMAKMTTQAPPPRDYIFQTWALTAGTYGLVYAPGDTGKSLLGLTLALTLALAGANCDVYDPLSVRPRQSVGGWPVVYVTGEDSDDAVWHRVHTLTQVMGADAYIAAQRNMTVHSTQGLADRPLITDPGFRGEVSCIATAPRLVVLDTLTRFHAAEENSNNEMAAVVASIESIAHDTGAAVLAVHHVAKSSQATDGVSTSGLAIRGASCIRENARWALGMAKVDEDVRVLVEDKHNDGRGHDPIYAACTSAGTLERCEPPAGDGTVTSIAGGRRRPKSAGGDRAHIY